MMGGQSSKKRGDEVLPPPQMNDSSQYAADLRSYEAACRLDPDLQTFDAALHERTSRVIDTLAADVDDVRSLSFDSLKEVTDCLLEINQEVVKVILKSREDIWKNQELFALVEEYFENSILTLDFCTALENALKRARNSQLIIRLAVKRFEEEAESQVGVEGKKYLKTVEELNKFKAVGDPFTEEFFMLFQSVYKQQLSMLRKLQLRKDKLDKKMKSMKTWKRLTNVLFVAAFVSVLIFSVVAAAVAAPPFVTALASALAVPIGSVGKWCNSLWNGYEKELKRQRELVHSMKIGACFVIKDMDNIRVLVDRLEIQIQSLLENADLAIREEEVMKLAIDEIKKKLDIFMETIENIGEHAGKCSRDIIRARTVILRRIIRHGNNSEDGLGLW